MTETQWFLGGLSSLIVVLIGIIIADHHRRLHDVEQHIEDHDKWAQAKAEELAAIKASFQAILQRFDRMDGRLDRIEAKLDRNGRH